MLDLDADLWVASGRMTVDSLESIDALRFCRCQCLALLPQEQRQTATLVVRVLEMKGLDGTPPTQESPHLPVCQNDINALFKVFLVATAALEKKESIATLENTRYLMAATKIVA